MESDSNCGYDDVQIYDGSTSDDQRLGKFCDTARPPTIHSSGNRLLMILATDTMFGKNGIHFAWEHISKNMIKEHCYLMRL